MNETISDALLKESDKEISMIIKRLLDYDDKTK